MASVLYLLTDDDYCFSSISTSKKLSKSGRPIFQTIRDMFLELDITRANELNQRIHSLRGTVTLCKSVFVHTDDLVFTSENLWCILLR